VACNTDRCRNLRFCYFKRWLGKDDEQARQAMQTAPGGWRRSFSQDWPKEANRDAQWEHALGSVGLTNKRCVQCAGHAT